MGIVIPWEPFCLTARFRLDEIKYCWEATIFFGAFETSECAYEWFDGIKPLIPEDLEDLGKHVYAYGWREVWDLEPAHPARCAARFCLNHCFRLYSSRFPGSAAVAQLAVNELVVGSNPTRGADDEKNIYSGSDHSCRWRIMAHATNEVRRRKRKGAHSGAGDHAWSWARRRPE